MKQYELMVIVDPDIGTDAIKKRLEEIKKMIAKQNGEIFFEDIWELLDLAYKIKKRETGYYAVFDINIEGEAIKELDNIFKLENEILRHMFVSLPSGYEPKIFKDSEKEQRAAYDAQKEELKKEKKAPVKKAATPPIVEKEEKPEKEPEKVAEAEAPVVKEKVKAKKVEPKKDDKTLEEVDKKLSDILDNPDLNF